MDSVIFLKPNASYTAQSFKKIIWIRRKKYLKTLSQRVQPTPLQKTPKKQFGPKINHHNLNQKSPISPESIDIEQLEQYNIQEGSLVQKQISDFTTNKKEEEESFEFEIKISEGA